MKRTRRGGTRAGKVKAKAAKRPRVAAKRPAARKALARGTAAKAPRAARPNGARGGTRVLPPVPEGDVQRADPVEAALADPRTPPETPLFDRAERDDDLAELLGEEFVRSVTSGEEQGVELRDEPVPEEEGGPFVETSGRREFAYGPGEGEPEPLPTAHRAKTRVQR